MSVIVNVMINLDIKEQPPTVEVAMAAVQAAVLKATLWRTLPAASAVAVGAFVDGHDVVSVVVEAACADSNGGNGSV